eukprot:TRINITY_DN42859_c0_g1_i1.p1 TRINITY_DN42859_c0_g1~~TRINITY_DN42859_c0_g1_i1.p1  ORF type:complete len:466 (+),score=48.82 TRINITY_DN42859_c0_g1_i1:50-1399(+)
MERRTVMRRQVAWGLATFAVPIVGQASLTSTPFPLNLYAQDVAMPGCSPLSACPLTAPPGYTGSMVNRGLCVLSGGKNACWDVCNPEHQPADYQVSSTGGADPGNSLYNHISQGLVGSVRQGLNNNVSCPAVLQQGFATEICVPGSECTAKMRHRFNIPRGRGLCVVDSSARGARICMDMCNLKNDPSKFAQGSPAGTHIKVVEFRASGACQDKPWIAWLLAILGIALLLCCCAAGYYTMRRRPRKGSEAAAMKDLDQDMLEESPPPGVDNYPLDDYQQDLPPQGEYGADPYAGHFDDGQNEYGANPPSMDRDSYHYQRQEQQRSMSRGVESFHPAEPVASPGGSMRAIPGLDEPHLQIPQMQQGHALGSPQSGSVPRLSSAGAVAPQLGLTYTTAPAAPQGTFQTQLPNFAMAPAQPMVAAPMYAGTSPAVSYQFQPGAMAPQQQFYR